MEDLAKPDSEPPLRVGLTYNLKKNIQSDVPDIEAEYDHIETIQAIQKALEKDGHKVVLLEADEDLPAKLRHHPVDIIFNIAEGIQGRGREAQVPAILNFYKIPYTGSDETTLCVALDKALTKRLLSTYHIRTPKYQVAAAGQAIRGGGFTFPVIVKPNAEGSSKGISDVAIIENLPALRHMVSEHIRLYRQDMLVEEYIGGREFTVGVLGNGTAARVFPPMEIIYLKQENPYQIYSYQVKQNYKALIQYQCPAVLEPDIEHEMITTARKIYTILACKDFARMDFRLSPDGRLYFIEINPLPGLAPDYSDYPMIAAFNGLDYSSLVCGILNSALRRYGLLDDPALG